MAGSEQQTERVTKLDAARRQLTTALMLFFEERDLVAILTLAQAAHGILSGLAPPGGNVLKDAGTDEGLADAVRYVEGFFRSSDLDPGEALNLVPALTLSLLADCILMHRSLTRRLPPEHGAFLVWLAAQPDAPFPVRGPARKTAERMQARGLPLTKRTFLVALQRGKFTVRMKPRPKPES